MGTLDLFLNLAIVSLWLSWRGFGAFPTRHAAGTLAGNLRLVEKKRPKKWVPLLGVVGLILGRPVLYTQLGRELDWVALWSPGPVTLAFRSDLLARMMFYSVVSAIWTVILAYSWLLLLASLGQAKSDQDPITRLLRHELAPVCRLPGGLALLAPILAGSCLWLFAGPMSVRAALGSPIRSPAHLIEQATLVGLGVIPSLRLPLMSLCVAKGVLRHVYFGTHPFWAFVEHASERACRPFVALRFGRWDFSPLAALIAVWLAARLLGFGFSDLKSGVSLHLRWLEVGLLPWLFERLPL
jgi:hypothetical protein